MKGPAWRSRSPSASERLRAMQVGSPVELELGFREHYRSADDAYAVTADLRRQFADRHERGDGARRWPGSSAPVRRRSQPRAES